VNDQRKRIFPLFLIIVLLTSTMGVAGAPLAAQAPELSDPAVVQIYVDGQAQLNAIAGELDIWEVHLEKGFAVAAVTPAQYQWLQSLGYRLEIDAEKTALLGIRAPLDPRFYYFDDFYTNPNGLYIVDFLQGVNDDYPDLTELLDIGDAWLAGQPGEHDRDIWVLRISNEDAAYGPIADKPAFFLFANIHAREVATPELAIRYIKYLTDGYLDEGGYGLDADVTWLVNHNVVYVLVMQNPDGHVENEQNTGNNRRKNMDNDDGCNDPYNWGVDLNRNHSFKWGCCGGSSGSPCDILYRGPARASEPETWAFQFYFATVMLDQNGPNGDDTLPPAAPDDATGIFLSLHQYGDEVLWPYGFDAGGAPNNAQLQTIGRKFAYYNGYDPTGFLYTVDGATDDWTYGKFGIASFTYEVGTSYGSCGGFFPDYECIDGALGWPRNFWAENRPTFLYAHKIARTPYMTSYGPDTENVAVVPGAAAPGSLVDVTATIADHRYGGDALQPIAAAEYFVDAPGDDGTGTPMAASDGGWGGLSEDVEAVLNTTGLATGQHYVLVHGQNDDGDWGPFTAAFLYIVDPAVAPVIEGYVRDANTNTPLAATVTADAFQDDTDPATGFYSMMVISDTYEMSAIAAGYAISTATGIEASDYQTVQQDFYLYPICEAFADDVESGNQGWTAQVPWAITTEDSYSPTHSWTDSPGGDYSNNRNVSLTSPVLDLSGYEDVTLSLWHTYDMETGWDYGYVEYSIDGGVWTEVASYSGYGHTTWTQEELSVPALDGESNVRIRFRFYSDGSQTADGWHIDDIVLSGRGPACAPSIAPTAEFTSNSPVQLGETMIFTNLTTGTLPIDYWWDFGDGVGTSTESDPEYTYLTTGTFIVTLVATNTVGSDSVDHPVVVLPGECIDLSEIAIAGDTIGEPGTYTFTTSYEPPAATLPITYTWDNGDGTPTSVRALDVGTHTLAVTATNCAEALVTDTHTIVIGEPAFYIYLPLVIKSNE
jgi:carboxypeptidase T